VGAAGIEIRSLEVVEGSTERFPTGVPEVDRVLGGGLVPGAVLLVAGEPGIGKSTLVLQLLDSIHRQGRSSLLVTGEESLEQVGLRAARLGMDRSSFRAAAATSLKPILEAAISDTPDVLVVDSIQTLQDEALDQVAGSPTQVRGCTASLVRFAKGSGTVVVLVGHVTKEGTVAGPKTLEHVVDVVLTLEGERMGTVRLLRSAKNRFGSCEETGVFTMGGAGLAPVPDPSAMLLADRCTGVAGSVVLPSLEGRRPMLIEVQALVPSGTSPQARRVTSGIDQRRLSLMLGVLAGRAGVSLADRDVFLAAAGGFQVKEPAADLAIALALYSAARDIPIPDDVVAFGELGLGGEVRRVPGLERRLREAARLGFKTALVPRLDGVDRPPMRLIEVARLHEAFAHLPSSGAPRVASQQASQDTAVVSLGTRQS
jgi:DNA repair protein RadA/Sms